MDQRPDFLCGHDIDELIECLAGDSQCPLCGAPYSHDGLQVVQTDTSRWILSVYCHCCSTGSLITAAVPRSFGTRSARTLLRPASELNSVECSSLSADDVLDIHIFLSHFHGDLSSLMLASWATKAA